MSSHLLLIGLTRNLILNAIVSGAYFVFGLLGLLFRFYGDPVGILMPSAGLALAAVLFFGNLIVPGIILGSFCLNAWAFEFKPAYLDYYLVAALGSSVAASVGAAMIRKRIGFPTALIDPRRIVAFMVSGGLLSPLISATTHTAGMLYGKILVVRDIPSAWLSWWLAEALGVLIFTPVIFSFFAQPYPVWSRRRATVGLPLILSFALVFLLFCYLQDVDRKKFTGQLKEKAAIMAQTLSSRVQADIHALHTVSNLLAVSDNGVENQELTRIIEQLISPFPEIQSVGWFNGDEKFLPQSRFTVFYNGKSPVKTEAFKNIPLEAKKKWQQGDAANKTSLYLRDKDHLQFVLPVSPNNRPSQGLSGVIVANVSLESLTNTALFKMNTNQCAFAIEARTRSSPRALTIYSTTDHADSTAYESIEIPVADQLWQLKFYHEDFIEKPIDDRSIEWIAFDGLCIVALLGMVLLYLTGRSFRTEALIEERTQTLREMKISAESANNAKNQFLAKISHELRTPLNGISGFTQLLEKKPSLTAEDKKHVAIIKQCSDNLLRLINDILDISAIESQQLRTESNQFDYQTLLNDCLNIFKFRADEKGLELISNNTCTVRKFTGDEKRIRQILANLVDNAIKYTNQGSITVSSSYTDGYLFIAVADTGCGISQNNLERIFTPFVQINSGNLSREGVGLGLSITRELVHLMNGELNVASGFGRGSIFTVRIPLPVVAEVQQNVALIAPSSQSNIPPMRVLVVDDSEINLLFLVCLLEQLGCKVDTARNGRDALALAERQFYDLALIDINMPIMNGLELVLHLRNRQLTLCLVAVSAYADEERINEALKVGFDAYLTKPIEEKELVDVISLSKKRTDITKFDESA